MCLLTARAAGERNALGSTPALSALADDWGIAMTGVSASNGRNAICSRLAIVSLLGPVAFTVLVIVQGLEHPDYSHVALPISALAAWPRGWIQSLNFIVLAAAMAALAISLQLSLRPEPRGVIGSALLALSAFGLLLAALFPWQRVGTDFVVPVGHLLAAPLTFPAVGAGLMMVSRRMTRDPRWKALASYVLVTGASILVLFVALMGFARADDAPLHPWAGIVQRLTLAEWFPCMIVLSLKLRRP